MDKWDALRKYFFKQSTELDEDDDCAIFALEVLDLMDLLEDQERKGVDLDEYVETRM